MVGALITWSIGALAFVLVPGIRLFTAWRAARFFDPASLGTIYTIESPYYDAVDKRGWEASKLTFPGTRYVVACRRSSLTWTASEFLGLGPEEDPLILRVQWGTTRKHCLYNLSKESLEPATRLHLTRMVMRKTMSPAVMESIAKVMKEIA